MVSLVKTHLSLKFLAALIVVLAVSFMGLSFSILKRQNALLNDMSARVDSALNKTGQEARQSFDDLEGHVGTLLGRMKDTTALNLSRATQSALEAEEAKVQKAMESFLLTSAEGVTALLNSVTPSAIMNKKFGELVKYSKAAAQTDEIIYALFFDKEGEPYPGFLNARDPRIKGYIKSGKTGSSIQKVISQSKIDPEVVIFEQPIKYFGAIQGRIIICMSRVAVLREIAELASRFDALNADNNVRVNQVIEAGSAEMKAQIQKELRGVTAKNSQAIKETGALLNQSAQAVNASIKKVIIAVGITCSLIILALIAVLLKIIVVDPIKGVAEGLKDTAQGEGDLTKRLAADREDEIGILANWFDAFLERLNKIIVGIGANARTVTRASEGVLSSAVHMSKGAEDMSDRANAVAAATEQMSANMDSVAAASEQASTNVRVVSDSAGQMKLTLNEVASNCDRARNISESASMGVATASEKVGLLGEAAKEISKVTEVITDIAEQTNLLALNATIEAARAGEAGKGFAVVAGEIKGLATQTASATQEIRERVNGIQTSTDYTVSEVGNISSVIAEVNEIVVTIAAAIEEQSNAATEVAENIDQAYRGIEDVNENVAQSSQVSTEIARDITQVNTVAQAIYTESEQMKEKAGELSGLSATLQDMISVFKVSEKPGA